MLLIPCTSKVRELYDSDTKYNIRINIKVLRLNPPPFAEVAVVCPEGWTKFEGRCYSLVTNYHDISVCRDQCRAQGGDLASIHSQRENDFVANFIQSRPSRGGEKVTRLQ